MVATSRLPLTPRQAEVRDWIAGYMRRHGYAPSVREIMAGLGFRSPHSIALHLRALEQKGYLVWRRRTCRGIRLSGPACAYCGR